MMMQEQKTDPEISYWRHRSEQGDKDYKQLRITAFLLFILLIAVVFTLARTDSALQDANRQLQKIEQSK